MPPCPSHFVAHGPVHSLLCVLCSVCDSHNKFFCKAFGMTKMEWSVQYASNYV